MPTLDWIGKKKVVNHHLDVPFRILERRYGYDENGRRDEGVETENAIIRGDNLEALKALLPRYEGRVKCIYIDPPYNTGNESWVYNDNVDDPKIRKWLGEVVGKEGEDLSRHDKWLCMTYPRLRLLQRLLADDGAIFISVDDNEQANLKLICDEIFGSRNFVANIVWQKRTSPDARINLGAAHDFILCFAKSIDFCKPSFHKLPYSSERENAYKNPDNDPRGSWASVDLTGQTGHATENQYYSVLNPFGEIIFPPKGRCWALAEKSFLNLIEDNRIWFGANGKARPRQKKFLREMEGSMAWTWWTNKEVGDNQEAKKELQKLSLEVTFDTPKPSRLIERVLQIATDKDSLVLDSFAGSGTTAHAVLKLNQADGGNRKFILIEMEDYAETITAERVKRVVDGYGEGAKAVPGTGGAFNYYELGEPLLQGDFLNENASLETIREYVYFTETKRPLDASESKRAGEPYLLGVCADVAYYFYYEKEKTTELSLDFLETLKPRAERRVIYADVCRLSPRELERFDVCFKKIPRDISRL